MFSMASYVAKRVEIRRLWKLLNLLLFFYFFYVFFFFCLVEEVL